MPDKDAHESTGTSELKYFVRLANSTCEEAIGELEEQLEYLESLDTLYIDFIKDAGGIKPGTAAVLLLNAHASWRASVRLALSGQLLPVFMTLRGSIESSLYANAMVVEPGLQKIWLERNNDKESKNACRNAFTISQMFRYLEQAHDKEFTDGLRDVYGATIDFGAHPNSHSVIRSTLIEELESGNHAVNFAYIHGSGSFELRQSLVACAEVGVAVFFILLICHEKHPGISELNDRALDIHTRIPSFVESLGLASYDE